MTLSCAAVVLSVLLLGLTVADVFLENRKSRQAFGNGRYWWVSKILILLPITFALAWATLLSVLGLAALCGWFGYIVYRAYMSSKKA